MVPGRAAVRSDDSAARREDDEAEEMIETATVNETLDDFYPNWY